MSGPSWVRRGGVLLFQEGDPHDQTHRPARGRDASTSSTTDLREEFEERAGIVEYDGDVARAHAECLALLIVLQRHPEAIVGLTVLEMQKDGETYWVVTNDCATALQVRHAERRGLADVPSRRWWTTSKPKVASLPASRRSSFANVPAERAFAVTEPVILVERET